MTITRGFAAGAMLAGLALVVTAPVSTADPLNGHYIETETYPDGHQAPQTTGSSPPAATDAPTIQHLGQAHLVNGQWTLDGKGGVSCEEGGDVRDAINFHYTWDPNTLDGTVQITNNVASLWQPAGLPGDQQAAPGSRRPRRRSPRGHRSRVRRTPASRRRIPRVDLDGRPAR